ncbi:MAG TPA: hypothetical protein VKA08_10700 [Balneolales bacterium]|nr:hypothetical protein [Balneolales bacterium]
MAFFIEHYPFGAFQAIKLVNRDNNTSLTVLPDFAGLINDYVICDEEGNLHSIIDGYTSAEELLQKHGEVFKSAKLSPFPNRIRSGVFTFNDNQYQLFVNFPHEDNSIHGLVYDKAFRIEREEEGEDYAHLTLAYDYKGKQQGFPYVYFIQLDYQLHEKHGLTVTTTIRNTGQESIPIGDGWHPYYKTGSKVDNLEISIPSQFLYKVDDQRIPTGEKVEFDAFAELKKINDYDFDSCFELASSNGKAIVQVADPSNDFHFTIWQETGDNKYNYLQVYTPPNRKSIAFEPMTCPPDVFNNKIGLIALKPKDEISFSWGVNS